MQLNQIFNPANYYSNTFSYPIMLVSILIISIGVFVLKQNNRAIINIAFFLQCFSVSFWLFTISIFYLCRSIEVGLFWYRYFTLFGVVNIMPSVYLFSVAWSGEFKRKRALIIVNYIIPFLFYLFAIATNKVVSPYNVRRYFWGFYPVYGTWAAIFLIFFSCQFFVGVKKLYLAYRHEKILIKRMQLGTITIATLIAFSAALDFLPKFLNISLYPFGYISVFIYICLAAYSIVRYKAFDIETVIHKTIMWLLTFSFIIIPIFFLYKWLFPYIRDLASWQIIFWIISFLTLALYLRTIQPKIDHFFQRRRFDLEEISSRFTEDLVHLKGLTQLIQRIEDTITDTLYPQRIDVFILNERENSYRLANVISSLKEPRELRLNHPFLLWSSKNNKIIYREFVDIDPAYREIKEGAKDYFELTLATVFMPLVLNEKLLGIINLGKKSNLKHYSAVDFHFLNTLKNQSTIAISNSLLYENIEEQVRERTKELIEVQKQLVQAEKLATVGTLAGGVAHEINNPLTAILTNVQMLLATDTIDSRLDRESLELIEEATKRCRTIVQKLMAYAKKPLEATQISRVSLLNVVKNVASFLEYQLGQENIRIIVEAGEDDYFVIGNHNELEQVVTNIVLNAKDAIRQIKKSGDVHISFAKSDDWIKIQIRDEGIGIPMEILSKIFDPFFTTKEVGKGTGLGLSICQAIVEKHKGLITVQSEANKGTKFLVQFPLAIKKKVELPTG